MSNALKFRRPDVPPKVRVSAERVGNDWELCVADNGLGVDPTQCRAVFDAFRRLHNQSEYEGSGLGLAICQQIVEQHGGRIWMTSREGEGSAVRFVLPAAPPAPSERPAGSTG